MAPMEPPKLPSAALCQVLPASVDFHTPPPALPK
jgi:hypothetical protein